MSAEVSWASRRRRIFFAVAASLILSASLCSAADRLVPSQFPSIAYALASAQEGDRVLVAPGTYTFFMTFVRAPNVTIEGAGGAGQTFLNAPYGDTALMILARDVCVVGFTIRGMQGMSPQSAAVLFSGVKGGCVRQCFFTSNSASVAILGSENVTVANSTFTNIPTSGFGVFAGQGSAGIRVESNRFDLNSSVQAVRLDFSRDSQIVGNEFLRTGAQAGQALVLVGQLNKPATNFIVSQNTFSNVYQGIFFQNVAKSTMSDNLFQNTAQALAGGIGPFTFFHNRFLNAANLSQVSSLSGGQWSHPALQEGNFWSDYGGLDNGSGSGKHAVSGDGIGDTSIPWPGAGRDQFPFIQANVWDVPPILRPIGNRSLKVGQSTSITLAASDSKGLPLVFSAANLPPGVFRTKPATVSEHYPPPCRSITRQRLGPLPATLSGVIPPLRDRANAESVGAAGLS